MTRDCTWGTHCSLMVHMDLRLPKCYSTFILDGLEYTSNSACSDLSSHLNITTLSLSFFLSFQRVSVSTSLHQAESEEKCLPPPPSSLFIIKAGWFCLQSIHFCSCLHMDNGRSWPTTWACHSVWPLSQDPFFVLLCPVLTWPWLMPSKWVWLRKHWQEMGIGKWRDENIFLHPLLCQLSWMLLPPPCQALVNCLSPRPFRLWCGAPMAASSFLTSEFCSYLCKWLLCYIFFRPTTFFSWRTLNNPVFFPYSCCPLQNCSSLYGEWSFKGQIWLSLFWLKLSKGILLILRLTEIALMWPTACMIWLLSASSLSFLVTITGFQPCCSFIVLWNGTSGFEGLL